MKTEREKKLEIALLKEKIERISNKKVTFEGIVRFLKKGTNVTLTTNLYNFSGDSSSNNLLTDADLSTYANKGDVFIADGLGVFEGPDGQTTTLMEDWYEVV